ncbi:MAG: indole-3-glycerol phosphate synthase TrpC [Ferruginibacter sp.]
MNILKQIVDYKKAEVEVRKVLVPQKELEKSSLFKRRTLSLKRALQDESKTGIIAEFKRKSPHKGYINREADVKKVTGAYTKFGASGLSVLTDNHFFGGNAADLIVARKNDIPVLRKDFIIDPYQLFVSKAMGADVVMLIAACLSESATKNLASEAKNLGLEVILEIHDEKELGHICNDIDMVGINNRNLKNFEVDIKRSVKLSRSIPGDKIMIAESGINDIETIRVFREAGYKGFLIGEAFMKEKDPGKAFGNFVKLLNKP